MSMELHAEEEPLFVLFSALVSIDTTSVRERGLSDLKK
jgi:hypothetical protein